MKKVTRSVATAVLYENGEPTSCYPGLTSRQVKAIVGEEKDVRDENHVYGCTEEEFLKISTRIVRSAK